MYILCIFRTYQAAFDGIFPKNNPRDTRFSINFFTSIGIGGLTFVFLLRILLSFIDIVIFS